MIKNETLDQTEVKKKIMFRNTEIELTFAQAFFIVDVWESIKQNYNLSLNQSLEKSKHIE